MNFFCNVMINGKTITCSGKNIIIKDSKIIVDGKILEDNLIGNITVVINSDVSHLNSQQCGRRYYARRGCQT